MLLSTHNNKSRRFQHKMSREISRRQFLKESAVVSLSVVATGLLGGCGVSADAAVSTTAAASTSAAATTTAAAATTAAAIAATTAAAAESTAAVDNTPAATMGQIADLLVEKQGWSDVAPAEDPYGLTASDSSDNILRLLAKGALTGEEKLDVDSPMSREAFFVMAAKILGLPGKKGTSIYHFKDVDEISEDLLPILNQIYVRGILTGNTEENMFYPKKDLTVAALEEAVDRAYNRKMAPAGCTLTPLSAPYLTKNFNRFGKMDPSLEMHANKNLIREEPFNIVDNIYFVGNTWTASYLIDTDDGLILIDGSCHDFFELLIESIYKLGFDPKDIKYMVVSHAHPDHYGCVLPLKAINPDMVTFVGDVDTPAMISGLQRVSYDITEYGFNANGYVRGDRSFIPDVMVKDYDVIELGNTKIECVTTPGHSDGVQSHFWTTPSGYRIGLYGGAGFSSMGTKRLESRGFNAEEVARWQKTFVESIDKVWDREIDIMLGNHPFHADLFEKHERVLAGEKDAFQDPTEWHRYLQELKDCYAHFLTLSQDEIDAMYTNSALLLFRDKSLDDHEWPWVEVIE